MLDTALTRLKPSIPPRTPHPTPLHPHPSPTPSPLSSTQVRRMVRFAADVAQALYARHNRTKVRALARGCVRTLLPP